MDGAVEAEFRLVDGAIRSWRIEGDVMADALRQAQALDAASDEMYDAISSYDVAVEYDGLGTTAVDVKAPDRARLVTPSGSGAAGQCRDAG